jgi:hypothetical protein
LHTASADAEWAWQEPDGAAVEGAEEGYASDSKTIGKDVGEVANTEADPEPIVPAEEADEGGDGKGEEGGGEEPVGGAAMGDEVGEEVEGEGEYPLHGIEDALAEGAVAAAAEVSLDLLATKPEVVADVAIVSVYVGEEGGDGTNGDGGDADAKLLGQGDAGGHEDGEAHGRAYHGVVSTYHAKNSFWGGVLWLWWLFGAGWQA